MLAAACISAVAIADTGDLLPAQHLVASAHKRTFDVSHAAIEVLAMIVLVLDNDDMAPRAAADSGKDDIPIGNSNNRAMIIRVPCRLIIVQVSPGMIVPDTGAYLIPVQIRIR